MIKHFLSTHRQSWISCAAFVLTACGGGGGQSAPTIATSKVFGTVLRGQPVAGASVTANCSDGKIYQGTTDANGRFNLSAVTGDANQAVPCFIKAVSENPATTLYSFAKDAGFVNVNPLTDLTLRKAFPTSLESRFQSFAKPGQNNELVVAERNAIVDATQFAYGALLRVGGGEHSAYTSNGQLQYKLNGWEVFSSEVTVGDEVDKNFDTLAVALSKAGVSFAEFQKMVEQNGDRRESFDQALYDLTTKKIKPAVSAFSCVESSERVSSGVSVACTLKGSNLTVPTSVNFNGGSNVNSSLGISLSLATSKTRSGNGPITPVHCSATFLQLGAVSKVTYANKATDPAQVFATEIVYGFNCFPAGPSNNTDLFAELTTLPINEVYSHALSHTVPRKGSSSSVTPPPSASGDLCVAKLAELDQIISQATSSRPDTGLSLTHLLERIMWMSSEYVRISGQYCAANSPQYLARSEYQRVYNDTVATCNSLGSSCTAKLH